VVNKTRRKKEEFILNNKGKKTKKEGKKMSDEPKDQKPEQTQYSGQGSTGGGGSPLEQMLQQILQRLLSGQPLPPIPFTFKGAPGPSPEEMDLMGK